MSSLQNDFIGAALGIAAIHRRRNVHHRSSSAAFVSVVALLAACTPSVHKNEVASFAAGVADAATAFESLRQKQLSVQHGLELDAMAANRTRLGPIGDDCGSDFVFLNVDEQLQCMGDWARFRAARAGGASVEPPSCTEPARDSKTGEPTYFSFAELAESQGEACRLGVATADSPDFDAAPLVAAEDLLPQTVTLLPLLAQYAEALAAIADAKDSQDLRTSVGKATSAIENTVKEANERLGLDVPIGAIGPVSGLVGEALLRGLEYRRWRALKNLTARADPVIASVAAGLSRSTATLELNEIQAAANEYQKAIAAFNAALPEGEMALADKTAWAKGYSDVRRAGASYLATYETGPTPVLKAMAAAHHALVLALADPARQFENLQETIATFREKAKAAYEVYTKVEIGEKTAQNGIESPAATAQN